jgi:flavin reductase (DIM6/NTAB) family NADH-FMN oxidoreductase RutF
MRHIDRSELFNPPGLVIKLLRAKAIAMRGLPQESTIRRDFSFPMMVTQTDFRKALGSFATGVTVITVDYEGEVHGMTANAFSSVSLDPPLVLVCVDHRARTHAHLHARKRFGVNVLAETQQIISEYYARPAQDHRHAEQEAGAHFDRTAHGTPVLNGALAYLECRLHTAQDAGDHTIFIAEVEEVVVRGGDPLLYHRGEYRTIGGTRTS